eukprot:Gb_16934 [translate_table: standard]
MFSSELNNYQLVAMTCYASRAVDKLYSNHFNPQHAQIIVHFSHASPVFLKLQNVGIPDYSYWEMSSNLKRTSAFTLSIGANTCKGAASLSTSHVVLGIKGATVAGMPTAWESPSRVQHLTLRSHGP